MNHFPSVRPVIDQLVHDSEMSIERVILAELRFHVGREQAIGRPALLREVRRYFKIDDRVMRDHINELRKTIAPMICSSGGEGGGYYLAANPDELEEYRRREVHAKLVDYSEQESALRAWAERFWGKYSPEQQIQMF